MKEWITGRNPVFESLRAKRRHFFTLLVQQDLRIEGRLKDCVELARQYKLPVRTANKQQLGQIDRHNHQGVALEVSEYPYAALEDLIVYSQAQNEAPFFLLLDLIQDPQNLGSLLRTAELMHVHGIIIPSSQAAQVTPSVVSASSGATEHLLVAQFNLVQAIQRLKELDLWVYGLDMDERAKTPDKLSMKGGVALVVGNEGEGLRSLVRKNCDEIMRLPQFGKIDSLNAAVAGSIALYLARQART